MYNDCQKGSQRGVETSVFRPIDGVNLSIGKTPHKHGRFVFGIRQLVVSSFLVIIS